MIGNAVGKATDLLIAQARISFGTDVPEILTLSAQVIELCWVTKNE